MTKTKKAEIFQQTQLSKTNLDFEPMIAKLGLSSNAIWPIVVALLILVNGGYAASVRWQDGNLNIQINPSTIER